MSKVELRRKALIVTMDRRMLFDPVEGGWRLGHGIITFRSWSARKGNETCVFVESERHSICFNTRLQCSISVREAWELEEAKYNIIERVAEVLSPLNQSVTYDNNWWCLVIVVQDEAASEVISDRLRLSGFNVIPDLQVLWPGEDDPRVC
jgi:hypothetical protein